MKVIMVGPFPPPVHGMSIVNDAVKANLNRAEIDVSALNTAAPSLNRSVRGRLQRLPRIISGGLLLAFRFRHRRSALYMSASAGPGQIYDMVFLVIARLRRMTIFLHHHSFAYLDKSSWLMRCTVRVAGKRATHVVLASRMECRIQDRYPSIRKTMVVSNANFFPFREVRWSGREMLNTIGFLSNIAENKGIFDFLELCKRLNSGGARVRVKVAGPFRDSETGRRVLLAISRLPRAEYVGSKYGKEKIRFYESIDALVFPTRYINEAEPVTVLEALECGIPTVAYGRGAIAELLEAEWVIPTGACFAQEAAPLIERWLADPPAYRTASQSARHRFNALRAHSAENWNVIQNILRS